VPGRAGTEAVALEEDHLADAIAGKVPGDAGADDAAPDHDDFHRTLPGCTVSLPASIGCANAAWKNRRAAKGVEAGN